MMRRRWALQSVDDDGRWTTRDVRVGDANLRRKVPEGPAGRNWRVVPVEGTAVVGVPMRDPSECDHKAATRPFDHVSHHHALPSWLLSGRSERELIRRTCPPGYRCPDCGATGIFYASVEHMIAWDG